MSREPLDKSYSPEDVEKRWYAFWEAEKLFAADENTDKPPYSIVIPPPNVTGVLHMGHALNNTMQDIMCRYRRLKGDSVLWMPGTDHAGIATQNVVERKLAADGTDRHQLGREKFIESVWEWRKAYGSAIINQLKRLGASCDWDRERFTMDEGLSRAGPQGVRAVVRRGPDLPGRLHHQLVLPLPHGIVGPGSRARRSGRRLLPYSLSLCRRLRIGDGGHHPAGNHARRYGRCRSSR